MPVAGNRGYAASRYALEIGGASAGSVESCGGGEAYADVVLERSGADSIVRKHLGTLRYADVDLECGAAAGKPLFDWLSETLAGKAARRDGAVAGIDPNGKELSRLELSQALVSAIAFPALDAASKDAARITVSISPGSTRLRTGSGKAEQSKAKAAKPWLRSSFRLAVGGLDCTHVNRIAPLVVRQTPVDLASGDSRHVEWQPGLLEVPDLVVTLTEASAETWRDWHQSFVVEGNSGRDQVKAGTLELLAADLKTVVLTLRLHGLGIFRLAAEKVEAGSENVRRVTASMYCEGIELFLGPAPREAPAVARRDGAAVVAARTPGGVGRVTG